MLLSTWLEFSVRIGVQLDLAVVQMSSCIRSLRMILMQTAFSIQQDMLTSATPCSMTITEVEPGATLTNGTFQLLGDIRDGVAFRALYGQQFKQGNQVE